MEIVWRGMSSNLCVLTVIMKVETLLSPFQHKEIIQKEQRKRGGNHEVEK